ncbi:glycosyltransferase 6-like [Impatiens glandulifera]|uniref:glycosyltransferase 6-like n=1 Tax=Impatiens glandulifera TaxID=253017 RepID=UPI001FB087FF|nr:glycosyltransferase 6-like [Impatiens glandulifera]
MAKSRNIPRFCFYGSITGILICLYWLWSNPNQNYSQKPNPILFSDGVTSCGSPTGVNTVDRLNNPDNYTFYDDPTVNYSIGQPLTSWDERRREWLNLHPSFKTGVSDRVLILTGSQPKPCKNPIGDHLQLRLFKNKVDYCRIHGYDIYYSNTFLHSEMRSYWTKMPVVRAAMLAHPETEWFLWIDSDAIFTDMDFKAPLTRYKDYNMVIHGWPDAVFGKKSWVGANAGVFLMRNCQWSLDFMEVWAEMGPQSPDYEKWGEIQRSTFPDKEYPKSDDQSGLIYLIIKEKETWGKKIYLENEYELSGYWLNLVGKFLNISNIYEDMEKSVRRLRRRHAEVNTEHYAVVREKYLAGDRRPFITHFTGCQQCNGDHNPIYVGDSCWDGMEIALNFADNQVLRPYGFVHPDLRNGSYVRPVSFDYPA